MALPETDLDANEPSTYTKWLPLLIGFFVGPLGFHRMWVGRFQSGVTMFASSGFAMFLLFRHPELVAQIQMGGKPEVVPPDFLWGCLILLVTSVWATVDCLRLTVGKFKDGAGFRVMNWF
jgi:hypothetical protein